MYIRYDPLILVFVFSIMQGAVAAVAPVPPSVPPPGDQPRDRRNPLSITVEPERCWYALHDSVTIILANPSSDTVFVTPMLLSYKGEGEGWRYIINDLQTYWNEPAGREWYGSVGMYPVPPNGERRYSLALADIASSFPGEGKMKFEVDIFKYYAIGEGESARRMLDVAESWFGAPFMPPELSESTANLLRRKPGRRRRDTVVAGYDPLSNTPLIPSGIFRQSLYRLIIPDPFDTVKIDTGHKSRYTISWPFDFAGANIELVISKRQLWLRSNYSSPDLKEFFWCADITPEQYEAARAMIARHREEFEEYIPDDGFIRYLEWRNFSYEKPSIADRDIFWKSFKQHIHRNGARLVEMLNEELSPGGQIHFPDYAEFDSMREVKWE